MIDKRKLGKKGREAGKRFEIFTRKDLEEQGWIVVKWANQVDLVNNKLVHAKSKFNPFTKTMISISSGFPDFMCYRRAIDETKDYYEIIGVESKMSKYLDKEEKEKAIWLLNNKIFNKILISYKGDKRGEIKYYEFER